MADRLAQSRPFPLSEASDEHVDAASAGADIWFLIDRSGSMSSISEFVVSGFDEFFTKQRAEAGDATVTVVQFDDQAPHDVIVDGLPLDRATSRTLCRDQVGLLPMRCPSRRLSTV